MVLYPFLIGLIAFAIAYRVYGSMLAKKFALTDENPTPSHTMEDGVDFVPTKPIVLFGHHFSSIAGAGPIVGPILSATAFGWLPAIFWIILGSIFIGGVHDFSSIVASIRHKARSIAEIAKEYMGKTSYIIFLLFIWLSLVYVLIVFLDLASTTFAQDGAVATTSMLYILLAIFLGFTLYRMRIKLLYSTIVFVALVFLSIWIGHLLPLNISPLILGSVKKSWSAILLIYIFFASVLPVWILLQPRDYLSSFLLYSSVLIGAIGIIFGGFHISYSAYTSFYSNHQSLFPILFVTIACGAISGFHSLVASGTTSKQLNKETDAKVIGYGAMLMEGVVALISLSTIMIITKGGGKIDAIAAYADGISKFASVIGVPVKFGKTFGLLVLSAFVLTTLDTATRLARYVLQELFNWKIQKTRVIATLITIILPTIFAFIDIKDADGNVIPSWKAIWPVFGASNQLLATLVLLVISVWLIKMKKNAFVSIIPLIFMAAVTLTALFELILQYKLSAIGIIAIVLFALALYLIFESYKTLRRMNTTMYKKEKAGKY